MDREYITHEIREVLKRQDLTELGIQFTRWRQYQGFSMAEYLIPEKLMLIVTEVAEAMEAYRDDNRANLGEELADIIIRTLDLCGGLGIDIQGAVMRKMEINFTRPRMHNRKC